MRARFAAISAAALIIVGGPAAGAASAEDQQLSLWHWNVAGHYLHQGAADTGMVEEAVASIVRQDADFASFNELCSAQYDGVVAGLREAGWPVDAGNFGRYAPSLKAGGKACGGDAYGNAVFSKQPIQDTQRTALPHDGRAEHRNMLCVTSEGRTDLQFCSTHLTVSEAKVDGQFANIRQLDAVLERLDGFHARGGTAIVAGDFNVQPHFGRLDRVYAPSADSPHNPGNTGRYRELDDASPVSPGYGAATYTGPAPAKPPVGEKAKLDMIFVREDRIAGPYEAQTPAIPQTCNDGAPCSDHRALMGTVELGQSDSP